MPTEIQERLSRPFTITEEERDLLYQYHGGQNSMIYACSSCAGLKLGSNKPVDCDNNVEWMQKLLAGLQAELRSGLAIAEKEKIEADAAALNRILRRVDFRLEQINRFIESCEAVAAPHDLDIEEVLEHYITAALWSSEEELRISASFEDGDSDRTTYDRNDLLETAVAKMREDVTKFVNENHALLSTWAGDTSIESQTGHDFWFTRNRHGVGFWEPEWGDVGQKLTEAAQAFGEMSLTVSDGQVDIL